MSIMSRHKKILRSKEIEDVVNHLGNLSDLSDFDSDDDEFYGDTINCPSESYLNNPDDDAMIEMRLEQMFGVTGDFDDDLRQINSHSPEPQIKDTQILQNVSNDVVGIQNSEYDYAPPLEPQIQQDTLDQPYHSAYWNTSLYTQEVCTSVPSSPLFQDEITIPLNEVCEDRTYLQNEENNSTLHQETIVPPQTTPDSSYTNRNSRLPLQEITANDNARNSQHTQPSTGSELSRTNVIHRDRSKPREWKITATTHEIPVFDKNIKPKFPYNHKTQPIEIFEKCFPDYVTLLIVEQTNRYARQKNSYNWVPVTEAEIKAYLGVLIMMGLNPLPDMQLYWSSDPFYNNPEISKVFTLTRFKKITENLHLNDNEMALPRESPNYDKLFKLRPLITALNEVYQNETYDSSVQSIDECMVKFKGRSTLKQYMPQKPIKRGFKVWARCDAKTGYLYRFEIYIGKGDNMENEGLGYNVVMKLSNNLPMNTLVAFDNFFTGCNLMEDLYERKIYAVGTVRANRKGLPEIMKKQQNRHLRLKKHEFASVTAEPITAIKWMDTKEVTVLTTAHQPVEAVFVKRTQKDGTKKDILCPKAIASYTLSMGGVDLFDHFRSSYPIDRKSRKYWMRLFFFMFDASIINAYITYNCSHVSSVHGHRDFRLRLARALVNNYTGKKVSTPTVFKNKKGGVFGVPDEIRLLNVGIHLPEESSTYKRCRFCSTKKQEKRSKIQCSTCNVPLCAKKCFKTFHTE